VVRGSAGDERPAEPMISPRLSGCFIPFTENRLHLRRRAGRGSSRVSDDLGKDIEAVSSGDLALAHWRLLISELF